MSGKIGVKKKTKSLLCSIIDHLKYSFIFTLPIGDKENDLLKYQLLKTSASFSAFSYM